MDLWVLPLFGDRKPVSFLKTQFEEQQGTFSPDGRWVAYASDESGRNEVYVLPFSLGSAATAGSKWQISTGGGDLPVWRHDGKELFFRAADHSLMAVPATPGATFRTGAPQALFELPGPTDFPFPAYAPAADGQQFLLSAPLGDLSPPSAPFDRPKTA